MSSGHHTQATLTMQLVADYSAAHYFVTIGHSHWLFGVGRHAIDIEGLLRAHSYLFITAWNPAPDSATPAGNMAADQILQARIVDSGLMRHAAWGSNAHGGSVEQGWLVLDAPVQAADAWAREFRQAGILYWQGGEPVRLRMLWPRPVGVGSDPHVDWAG